MDFQYGLENDIFEWLLKESERVYYNFETPERLTDTLCNLTLYPSFTELLSKRFEVLDRIGDKSVFIRYALFAVACVPTHPYFCRLFNGSRLDWRNKAHSRKFAHAISFAVLSAIACLPHIADVICEPLAVTEEEMLSSLSRYISLKRDIKGFHVVRFKAAWLGIDNMRIDLLFYNGEFILAVPLSYDRGDVCYCKLCDIVDHKLYI